MVKLYADGRLNLCVRRCMYAHGDFVADRSCDGDGVLEDAAAASWFDEVNNHRLRRIHTTTGAAAPVQVGIPAVG